MSDDTLLEASGILLTWSPDPQGDAVYSLTGGGDLYAMYDGTWDTKQLEAADGSWRLDSSGWAKPRVTIRRTDAEAEAGTLWWRGYGAELVVSSGVRYRWRYGFLHRDFEIVDAAGTPLLKFGIQAWPQANTPSASAAVMEILAAATTEHDLAFLALIGWYTLLPPVLGTATSVPIF